MFGDIGAMKRWCVVEEKLALIGIILTYVIVFSLNGWHTDVEDEDVEDVE
jgi:hypothetical protein